MSRFFSSQNSPKQNSNLGPHPVSESTHGIYIFSSPQTHTKNPGQDIFGSIRIESNEE